MASQYSNEFYNDEDLYKSSEESAKNARKAIEEEANRAYNATINQLGSEEKGLRADQPLILEQLQGSINAQKTPILQGKEESLSEYNRQARDLGLNTKSLINTASRTFNELATGIPKYAGTSVAGAYGEILGRETARQIGQAKQTETLGMQDIGEAKNRVIRFASQKVADIEAQGQTMLKQAQQQFLNAMDKINTLRRIAEDDKKSLRLQALYKYKESIANINTERASNKLAIQKWVYEKNQELANRVGSKPKTFSLAELVAIGNDLIEKGADKNEVQKWISANVGKSEEEVGAGYGGVKLGSNQPSWVNESVGTPANLGDTSSNMPSSAFGNTGINSSINASGDIYTDNTGMSDNDIFSYLQSGKVGLR